MLTDRDIHDLNNKFCGIQGYIDLILDDVNAGREDYEKTHVRLRKIKEICEETVSIIAKSSRSSQD